MVGIGGLLAELAERLQRKSHVRLLTTGWERRIGIVEVDSQLRWQLTFSQGRAFCGEWTDDKTPDVLLQGHARELRMLLDGDELLYTSAKQHVRIAGAMRDQLKLDAILRLTSK